MRVLATTVQNHVAVSQGKTIAYERYLTDGKRQEHLFGGKRDIGDARKAFATSINYQMLQFQPCHPRLEISGARYREIDTYIAEAGCEAIGIAKRKCTTFCHMPRPVGPAHSSCDLLTLLSHRRRQHQIIDSFRLCGFGSLQLAGASDECALPASRQGDLDQVLRSMERPPEGGLSIEEDRGVTAGCPFCGGTRNRHSLQQSSLRQ
jgi:hypothetical protein